MHGLRPIAASSAALVSKKVTGYEVADVAKAKFQRVSTAVAAQKKEFDMVWVVVVSEKKITPAGVALILKKEATIEMFASPLNDISTIFRKRDCLMLLF